MAPNSRARIHGLTLEQFIANNYGTVYQAAKAHGQSEATLHRMIKRGAIVGPDGRVYNPSKIKLN